jgi:hypothetical protein
MSVTHSPPATGALRAALHRQSRMSVIGAATPGAGDLTPSALQSIVDQRAR